MNRACIARLFSGKGSVMVWAVCILLVLSVISAGVLIAGAAYYQRTLEDTYRKKAQLLAQSGMIYAKERITDADITGDYSWCPDAEFFELGIVSLTHRTVYLDGKRNSGNCAVIRFEPIENRSQEGYFLKVTSSAEYSGGSAECCGYFVNEGGDSWYFIGYTSS